MSEQRKTYGDVEGTYASTAAQPCAVPAGGADYKLVYEALRFYFWAAGEGLSPNANQGVLEPDEGFWQYGQRTGDDQWETVAERWLAASPSQPLSELRPEVAAFARLMETQLRANDHKPGWKNDKPGDLLRRAKEEVEELLLEIAGGPPSLIDKPAVGREAADVANMVMMVADVCGALLLTAAPTPPATQGGVSAAAMREAAARVADSEADDILRHSHLSRDQWQQGRLAMARTIAAAISNLPITADGVGQGWRGIESAPKDGTSFVTACFDDTPPSYEVGRYDPMPWTSYVEAGDGLYRRVQTTITEWRGLDNFHRATHWMPLPAAPTEQETARGE